MNARQLRFGLIKAPTLCGKSIFLSRDFPTALTGTFPIEQLISKRYSYLQ
jgi:hypothetical protein